LVKALSAEKTGIFPLEHSGAKVATDRVVGLVTQNGGHQQQTHHQGQVHQTRTAHGSDNEQQRVAGQKWHDHDTGFHKNDEKQQGIDPGPILGNKGLQVTVDVEDEINKLQKDVHGADYPSRHSDAGAASHEDRMTPNVDPTCLLWERAPARECLLWLYSHSAAGAASHK
jgi:hypothetical protein